MGNVKTARVVWKGNNLEFFGALGSEYTFDLAAPASAETGGSPMEFLLAGVAGCTASDVVHVLRKKRQKISGVEVEIIGLRADTHPQVYTSAEILYIIQGEDIDPKAVERAISLSQETYCSASLMFQQAGVRITTSYRIEEVAGVPI